MVYWINIEIFFFHHIVATLCTLSYLLSIPHPYHINLKRNPYGTRHKGHIYDIFISHNIRTHICNVVAMLEWIQQNQLDIYLNTSALNETTREYKNLPITSICHIVIEIYPTFFKCYRMCTSSSENTNTLGYISFTDILIFYCILIFVF